MSTNLDKWRTSFRLVARSSAPNQCKKGQTFRSKARLSSVEFGQVESTTCNVFQDLRVGTAKPGPTAKFDSELVRRRKIQVRTKSNLRGNSNDTTGKYNRTFRGYNSHVENGRNGFSLGARAQLFGPAQNNGNQQGLPVKGVRGDASDLIYFKPIFENLKLNVQN